MREAGDELMETEEGAGGNTIQDEVAIREEVEVSSESSTSR